MILTVPQDKKFFPTLGPQVCDFMEQNLVFGPGDLRGKPLRLDDFRRGLIYRLYEVYPRRHQRAGRRRFNRCVISLAKGLAKTELAALIAACELHPEAPVRCTGWTKGGEPIGGPVEDPYIPMVAYTEEQSEDLAFGALYAILELSSLKDDFHIGKQKIERKKGGGVALLLSANPNARDGARTTFMVGDETHRFVSQRLRDGMTTMGNNLAKRLIAQPWMLEITTAPEPGAGSVAEGAMNYARAIIDGRAQNTSFFFFHMQAGDHHDLTTRDGRRAAVIEASGPAANWRDIEAVVEKLDDPEADQPYWERVWCNRMVQSATQAFDVKQWDGLKRDVGQPDAGTLITLGFDGGMFHDSTALVATDVKSGFQWIAGLWECPPNGDKLNPPWQVPTTDVDETVKALFSHFNVWRMYADPPYWDSWIAKWVGLYGQERVLEVWTNKYDRMAEVIKNYRVAMREAELSHDGDPRFRRHIGNSRRMYLRGRPDDQGKPRFIIHKERQDSPNKIDAAVAGALSWEARTHAIAAGADKEKQFQMIFAGGIKR